MNGNANQLGIDFTKYGELKTNGTIKVHHLAADAFYVALRTFDTRTGAEVKPTIIQCDHAGIAEQVKILDDQIAALSAQRAGLAALGEDMKKMAPAP